MENLKDKPAFPSAIWVDVDNHFENPGMSLREYYAGLCLQGLISAMGEHDVTDKDELASDAVGLADALIKKLNKQP